ncbi:MULTISPECIES: hypothetical protein [Clavibacter]|uniref:Uncharacterized protein n=1 Tax=Clavibacter tessellarius TaxID=31965 RepID=A0A154UY31_9MICO|nr:MULTISPECIES: hypothetical protein [Clavibacter]KZC94053.1 hypothetical protein AWH51_15245 [Clavibacter michiganensis subsp. tessellarius]MBT1636368.1 hypothetical protein [Clavibacter michiganensis]MDA3803677.1 hypothetical protein [Clavibacter sp. CT19]
MNTSSTTTPGRSPLRPVRAASITALAAIAFSATVGLGIAHASASASATAASDGASVIAMGHNHSPADPGFDGSGLPSVGGWIRNHHGHG